MKVLKLNTPFEISAVLRIAPTQSDVLKMTIRNEVTDFVIEYTLIWTITNGRISFTLPSTPDFKAGNKYEIFITNQNSSEIIYRGKMIVVKEDTDIQNYTPSKQITQRFK